MVSPVLCILLWMGQWYTTAVGLPLSPYPACGCLYLCLSSRPYILCHESYPVQWLPQVGPTCGCRYASVCKENQGESICNSSFSQYQVSISRNKWVEDS